MSKITLPSIASGYASTTQLNNAFDAIETEFQDKVLYRNNPSGEPNQMEQDLDMNSNAIDNVSSITTDEINVGGVNLTAQVAAAANSASAAANSATTSSTQASAASASATSASTSASSAASSAATALTSKTAAQTAETNASSSASAASTSATNAATSASNAASSATSAATSANTATTQATNAASSATSASSSASSVSTSATTATAQATIATTKASEASTSATNAAASETNAASSATSASTSASTATTQATNASNSASAASTSATNASNSASAASTSASGAASSASAASTSASNALASEVAAEAALANFNETYLGAQATDPSVDNNGDPVTAGDWYFNTTSNRSRIYDGAAWNFVALEAGSFLASGNNLSDLANAATARDNLGVEIGSDVQAFSPQLATYASTGVGMRNRIINGAMQIDQRNAGASVTAGAYTLDRWALDVSAASKLSIQQNAGSVTPPSGFKNYLGATSTSAYSIGASEIFLISQPIEGLNVYDLGWGAAGASSVTLSFWVRSSLTGTFGGMIENASTNRNYVFSYTISSANTWEYKTITIAGDTSGTWLTTNGAGLILRFAMAAGTSTQTTAGSWGATRYFAPTGQASLVGTNGATWYITGVQLEKGSTATSFDYRPYGTELALCQRYFQKTYNVETVPGATGGYAGGIYAGAIFTEKGSTAGVNSVTITWQYKASMRANPTILFYSPASGAAGYATSGSTDFAAGINGPIVGQNNSLAYGTATGANDCYFHITAAAEL